MLKRKKIVIANWKMNEDLESSIELAKKIKAGVPSKGQTEMVLCPDFVALTSVFNIIKGSDICIGAQNVAEEEKGNVTGEVSVLSLKPYIKYIIVGHSERRNLIGEGDREIAKKAEVAIRHRISPIICVGETLQEREDGLSKVVVLSQLEAACKHLTSGEIAKSIIAYEPIWAIGSGKHCSAEDVEKIIADIRNLIKTLYGQKASDSLRIVYGGSVDEANAKEFAAADDLDGVLVGGGSLHAHEFASIIKAFEEVN